MAKRYENRIQETTQTTGTGNLSVDGATYRFKEFASELQTGDEFNYLLEDENGAWEIGLGELTTGSPNTIMRKQVFNSSYADSLIDLSDGIHRITLVISKESLDDIINSLDDMIDSLDENFNSLEADIDDHKAKTGGVHGIPEGERALHTADIPGDGDLGTAAAQDDTRYAHRMNNLSDLSSVATARNNLGGNAAGDRTVSTAEPSGGSDGDIWYEVD